MLQVGGRLTAQKIATWKPLFISYVTEQRFHVDSAGSQDLNHVMGGSGLLSGNTSGQEITLTINNSSLTQALASASCSAAGAGNPQEITLTISGMNPLIRFTSIQYNGTDTQLLSIREKITTVPRGRDTFFDILEGKEEKNPDVITVSASIHLESTPGKPRLEVPPVSGYERYTCFTKHFSSTHHWSRSYISGGKCVVSTLWRLVMVVACQHCRSSQRDTTKSVTNEPPRLS